MAEGKGIENGFVSAVEETRAKLRRAAKSIRSAADQADDQRDSRERAAR